jgi:oligopeptide transport system substrate-binding protein
MPLPPVLRRFKLQVTLAVILLLAMTAGAVALAEGLTVRSAASSPPREVLRWGNEGISDLYTLDPAQGPDFNARQATQLIFGGLVRFGPHFEIMPDAAARWDVSPDARTYTFYLRPGVRFGDGTLLKAGDVAYSLNRILNPVFAQQSGAFLLGDIVGAQAVSGGHAAHAAGIQVLNARTLRIHLIHPSGSFLAKLANPAGYIVPSWRIAEDPKHWDEHAIGTGPFKVERWAHNSALLLVPNPYYYGDKLHLDGIYMPFIPEPLAAYKRYRAGAIDLMGTVHFPTDVLYDVRGRGDFHRSPRLETVYLMPNTRIPPLNDTRVRQAFARAIDREALARDVYGGFAHPTTGMLPPGLPGYNPVLPNSGYSPTTARRLLAEAGFPGGRGLPTLSYPVDQDAQSLVLATELARQWQHVLGVHVQLTQYTHSSYLNLLNSLNFQIAVIDWTADYPDPENFLSQLLHSGSPNNNGGWSNPLFDQLTDRANRMRPGDPRRLTLYHRAEEIAMAQAGAIPLVNPTAGILLRSDVHGVAISGGYLLVRNWARVSVPAGTRP